MIRFVHILITFLLGIVIWGSGSLVINEITTGNGCPKVLGIPICVVIFTSSIASLITHLLKKYNAIFFFFTGMATTIALVASILQFTNNGECPKTTGGIPMCYYSLLLFTGLLVLKTYQLKKIISNHIPF